MDITKDWIFFEAKDEVGRKLDAVYVKSKKQWKLPNTLGALRELFKAGYDTRDYGIQKSKQRELYLKIKNKEEVTEGLGNYFSSLRPYQRVDVNFLAQLPHCAIFNEQRTGKTPTTLKLIELEQHEMIIVVCPASLVLNWEGEIKKWTSYKSFAVKGTKKKREKIYQEWTSKKGFLLIGYETLRNDLELLLSLKVTNHAFIADEAHRLNNYQSKQSKAIYQIGKDAKKRIALTGTPVRNQGSELYGIIRFLYPEKFPSYWQFVERYFKTWSAPWGSKEIGDYKRKEELQEILDVISVQRKRSEVMQWVPAKIYQTIEVEMDAKQRKLYNDMLELFIVEEQGEVKVDAPSVLAQLTRLRQICLSPDILGLNAPSAKESFLLEWLQDNPNEQVIIFSNYSSYLKELRNKLKAGPEAQLIIGETSKEMRSFIVNEFQEGNVRVILANIQAAGVGLTLDKASTVIFLDRDYVPANNEQAEDRIIPTTEESNAGCLIIDIECSNSIDQTINNILKKKENVTSVINNYRNIKEFLG